VTIDLQDDVVVPSCRAAIERRVDGITAFMPAALTVAQMA